MTNVSFCYMPVDPTHRKKPCYFRSESGLSGISTASSGVPDPYFGRPTLPLSGGEKKRVESTCPNHPHVELELMNMRPPVKENSPPYEQQRHKSDISNVLHFMRAQQLSPVPASPPAGFDICASRGVTRIATSRSTAFRPPRPGRRPSSPDRRLDPLTAEVTT